MEIEAEESKKDNKEELVQKYSEFFQKMPTHLYQVKPILMAKNDAHHLIEKIYEK